MQDERDGWSGFFGTVALSAVLLGGALALLSGYLIGHFSNPKEKTTTIARAGLPGIELQASTTPTVTVPAPAASTSTQVQTAPSAPAKTETEASGPKASSTTTTPQEPSTGKTPGGAGKTIFASNCASCHTLAAAGASGTVGPNLDQAKVDEKTVANQVVNGGGSMPAFGKNKLLSAAQIREVSAYVAKVAGK